jgi:hypothetical protein
MTKPYSRCEHCPAEEAWAAHQRASRWLIKALLRLPREQARDLLADAVQDAGQQWVDALRADLNAAAEKSKAG